MYRFLLWCPGCFFFLLLSIKVKSQSSSGKTESIPDTILNHGLILKEVVVKASPKIIVKRDTVSFSADAFMNNSEKVVEDLLKKIPGIEIAKDGSITVNGKKVERVLIEGDDLFKKDYAILSRNLSADLIDRVQVIDNYTDNVLLKGLVSNNNNKVINLTLKNKRKKILFGNISAGIGTAERTDISINLISFMNQTKIYCLGNYNTIGYDPVPGMVTSNSSNRTKDNSTGSTDNGGLVNIYRLYKAEVETEKINFNRAKLFSSFVSYNPCPNLTVRFSGWSFLDNNSFTQENDYNYYLKDSILSIREYNFYNKKPVRTTGNIDIAYRYAEDAELKLSSVLSGTHVLTSADMLSDNSSYYNKLKENSLYLSNTLSYTKRISASNALIVEASFSRQDEVQKLSIQQSEKKRLPFTGLFPRELYQFVSYPSTTASLFCHYLYTLKSWRVSANINITRRNQYLYSTLDTLTDAAREAGVISDSFLNKAHLKKYVSSTGFTLARQVKNLQMAGAFSGNLLLNKYQSLPEFQNSRSLSGSTSFYPSASINIKWKIKNQAVSAGYAYDTKFPEITDLYEGYILTDYRSLQKGISIFNSRPVHTVSLEYTFSNLPKQLLFYFTASCISLKNIPGSDLQLMKDYDIISFIPAVISPTYWLCASGIDKFILSLYGGIKIRTVIAINRYQGVLNSITDRQITTLTNTTQISFRSAFHGAFNYNIGVILNSSLSRVRSDQNMLFQNHILTNFLDMHFRCSDKWRITVNNERYYFNAINKGRKSYYFIDLSLYYDWPKNKLSFILTGKNLVNNRKYINTYVTDYSSQVQQYNLLPGYLLLQINYRFR